MPVNYTIPKPTAGTSRATAPTETSIITDVSDTIADIDSRLKAVTITSQAADYTLALADAGKHVEGTKATAQIITIPPASTVAFPVGTTINVRQMGAGQITLTPGAGVTLRSPRGAKTAVQYATATLVNRAADEWVVSGDVAV